MPRNITAAQKNTRDFNKNEVLAQTNQIKYTVLFAWYRKNKIKI